MEALALEASDREGTELVASDLLALGKAVIEGTVLEACIGEDWA